MKLISYNNRNKTEITQHTWCTSATVGAKKRITLFSPLNLTDLATSLISITAINVFPAPVSKCAIVFLFVATLKIFL